MLSSPLGLFLLTVVSVSGISYRCFSCRSRGDLGDCKDPFPYNDTSSDPNRGISIIPCRSGWCSKSMEGIRGPRDEFGTRTERSCLTNAPPDNEERCAEIVLSNKPSKICFCRGDLCNEGNSLTALVPFLVLPVLALVF